MKIRSARAFWTVLPAFAAPAASADIVLLPDPVSSAAATSFAADVATWGPQHLYDADPVVDDIGTDITGLPGNGEHAAAGGSDARLGNQHVVVFDYGAAVTFNGLAYAQRNGNGTAGVDKFEQINVWAIDTDPELSESDELAFYDLVDSLGEPEATTGPLVGTPNPPSDGTRFFDHYPLQAELSGRWVVFQMIDDGEQTFNPGGNELQLTIDTAPPDPRLVLPTRFDFGAIREDRVTVRERIPVSNVGASRTLEITGATVGGPDADAFSIVSFPPSLAPGASGELVVDFSVSGGIGNYAASVTIASNDGLFPSQSLNLAALVIVAVPSDLVLLPDPQSATAATSFSGDDVTWGPANLYDADPTVDDIGTDITALPGNTEHAAAGGSDARGGNQHVVVFDYGAPVSFSGLAYAQRNGNGTAGVDKFDSIDVWATDTDPDLLPGDELAHYDLVASLGEPQASAILAGTPDPPSTGLRIFDHYELGTLLSGRWVVFQMNDDGVNTFNPGGNELQLTLSGSVERFRIVDFRFDGTDATITWTSRVGETFIVWRSFDLGSWEEVDDFVVGQAGTTTLVDTELENARPPGSQEVFYRVGKSGAP